MAEAKITKSDEMRIDEMRRAGKTYTEIAQVIGVHISTVEKNVKKRHPEQVKRIVREHENVVAASGWITAGMRQPALIHVEGKDMVITQTSDLLLVYDGEKYWVARYYHETTEYYQTFCYREIENGMQIRAIYWCPIPAPTWS